MSENREHTIAVFAETNEIQTSLTYFANQKGCKLKFIDKDERNFSQLSDVEYDLIIIEIAHPSMSEIDYVDLVYEFSEGKPIVIISSYFSDTKDIVFEDKIAGFNPKPIEMEQFQSVCDALLSSNGLPKKSKPEEESSEAQKQSKKLTVLLEIARSLGSSKSLEELLANIISHATDILSAERATVFIYDEEHQEIWSKSGTGIDSKEIRLSVDSGIAGEVATTGKTQIIKDPYSHPKFNSSFDEKTGFKTRNMICVPMKNLSGDVIGVLQVLNKIDDGFTRDDEVILSAMAANTAIVIENTLLREELKKKLQEIKSSYDELYTAQNQIVKETKISAVTEMEAKIATVFLHEEDPDAIKKQIVSLLDGMRKQDQV